LHTPAWLIDASIAYFQAHGHTLAVDRPYRGTLVPTPWYGTDARVCSIMLEVNRALYLQPGTHARSADYEHTRILVQGYLDHLRRTLHQRQQAAAATA
jgi:N-formylglutamate amidohydrolase